MIHYDDVCAVDETDPQKLSLLVCSLVSMTVSMIQSLLLNLRTLLLYETVVHHL